MIIFYYLSHDFYLISCLRYGVMQGIADRMEFKACHGGPVMNCLRTVHGVSRIFMTFNRS